jgi:two-component system nitrogen regulation response regulator GlnG
LDEVADIPPHTQVKLLRALEEGEVLPVGSDHAVPTDFRLVSATHQHLEAKIRDGSFRHDLYFRLCAFSIEMPALRQRPEDIGELAHHFLNVTARLRSGPPPVLSAEAEEELARRPWFGNARELRNAIEHALTVARGGVIELHHLPQTVLPASGLTAEPAGTDDALMRQIREWTSATLARADASADVYERFLRLVEVPFLEVFLERHRGQCSTAARDLGLHRTTLRKKLDKYGIQIKRNLASETALDGAKNQAHHARARATSPVAEADFCTVAERAWPPSRSCRSARRRESICRGCGPGRRSVAVVLEISAVAL